MRYLMLSIILLSFLLPSIKANSSEIRIVKIENSSGAIRNVNIQYYISDRQIMFKLTKENDLQVLDSIIINNVSNFEFKNLLIEKKRFIRIVYSSPGGTGVKIRMTSFITIDKNDKFINSLLVISQYSHDIDSFWDDNAPVVDVYEFYEIDFTLIGPPYELKVFETDNIKTLNDQMSFTQHYDLKFDVNENIFYMNKLENNSYLIEFLSNDDSFGGGRYMFQNKKWYFQNILGKYIELK